MAVDRFIKCRFCDYRVRPFARLHGRVLNGWTRLQQHIENAHAEERLTELHRIDARLSEREPSDDSHG